MLTMFDIDNDSYSTFSILRTYITQKKINKYDRIEFISFKEKKLV